jgi:hypothetical protein
VATAKYTFLPVGNICDFNADDIVKFLDFALRIVFIKDNAAFHKFHEYSLLKKQPPNLV